MERAPRHLPLEFVLQQQTLREANEKKNASSGGSSDNSHLIRKNKKAGMGMGMSMGMGVNRNDKSTSSKKNKAIMK